VAEKPKAGGSLLTRKMGPFPGYVWLGAAAVGAVIYIRVRGGSAAADSSSADDTTAQDEAAAADDAAAAGGDFATPYQGAGVYTELANADAKEASEASKAASEKKRLTTYERNHPAGKVNAQTHVYTATAATTLQEIAKRVGVTVAALRRDNPNLKGDKVAKGERIHVTAPAKKKAAAKK
jgi:LysM repeat protein